jgi:hypothetical protein
MYDASEINLSAEVSLKTLSVIIAVSPTRGVVDICNAVSRIVFSFNVEGSVLLDIYAIVLDASREIHPNGVTEVNIEDINTVLRGLLAVQSLTPSTEELL